LLVDDEVGADVSELSSSDSESFLVAIILLKNN
jgi:hypothetical protein